MSVATIRGRGRVVKREAKRGKARRREPRARRARRGHIKGESELTKRAANCRLNASSTTAADSTPKSWEKGGYGLILLGAPRRSSYTARSIASARCFGTRSSDQTSSPTRDTSASHLKTAERAHSLTHSLTHAHARTHSLTHSFTHLLTRSLMHAACAPRARRRQCATRAPGAHSPVRAVLEVGRQLDVVALVRLDTHDRCDRCRAEALGHGERDVLLERAPDEQLARRHLRRER